MKERGEKRRKEEGRKKEGEQGGGREEKEKLDPPKEGKKSAFVSKTPLKAVCFLPYPPF